MTVLNPSMRLKVKGDTFFLPDANGSVYFRNNFGSFRMEGEMIDQWIEKLIPVLDGEHTLEELTDGLPDEYRDRVYEIAQTLYQNGFVRDVSLDRPHQLPKSILDKYAPQIEFLENFVDSGAYRFQSYRQSNVLAVGSGPFFVSLAAALLESGLPKFHMLITESVPTHRQRLSELIEHARKTDPEVEVKEITLEKEGGSFWRKAVQPFEAILYVSQDGNLEELRILHAVCREEKKVFLPALFLHQAGWAGPLVHPDSKVCWESALRRIHRNALSHDPHQHSFSSTAGALLANVMVFEWFKKVTGLVESEPDNKIFLLDLETLEGSWHLFLPHPLVNGCAKAEWVNDLDQRIAFDSDKRKSQGLLPYFNHLTSNQTGIFNIWEEGELKQLPLSQCRVQAVDPLSEGPAELLADMVCTGLTHEEARREAGLAGIEAYVSRLASKVIPTLPPHPQFRSGTVPPREFVGVGAGETVAEGVLRGLQTCLNGELKERVAARKPVVTPVQLDAVEDDHSLYYLQALTTMQNAPIIGLGEEVFGFPVVWVGTEDRWFGSAGLNMTMALRKALQHAIFRAQNQASDFNMPLLHSLEVSSVVLEEKKPLRLTIPSYCEESQQEILRSALQVIERNHRRLLVMDLAVEPFLKEELAVFGVLLRKEEFR